MPFTALDGKAIKIGRALRSWTQRDLAEAAGLNPRRLSVIENNLESPRPEELAKILHALSTRD